jgi:hypothetical protein
VEVIGSKEVGSLQMGEEVDVLLDESRSVGILDDRRKEDDVSTNTGEHARHTCGHSLLASSRRRA